MNGSVEVNLLCPLEKSIFLYLKFLVDCLCCSGVAAIYSAMATSLILENPLFVVVLHVVNSVEAHWQSDYYFEILQPFFLKLYSYDLLQCLVISSPRIARVLVILKDVVD